MKLKTLFKIAVLLAAAAVVLSCDWNPIFYRVSQEVEPTEARIQGSPTNMVVFERNGRKVMFVASGRTLHWYFGDEEYGPVWGDSAYGVPQPAEAGGRIISLAVTENFFYALVMRDTADGIASDLKRIGAADSAWTTINSGYTIQAVFADPEQSVLFASSRISGNSYRILHLNDNASGSAFSVLQIPGFDNVRMLTGIAYFNDTFYLSTAGTGIFSVNFSANNSAPVAVQMSIVGGAAPSSETPFNRTFPGLITLPEPFPTVVAVDRSGILYGLIDDRNASSLNDDNEDPPPPYRFNALTIGEGENVSVISLGNISSGALSIWRCADNIARILLAGIETRAYIFGYVEFDIGNGALSQRQVPGRVHPAAANRVHSSVDNEGRFISTLGTHPVGHLLQTPFDVDPAMTSFASTQNSGLWSYRHRGVPRQWQWNAEE